MGSTGASSRTRSRAMGGSTTPPSATPPTSAPLPTTPVNSGNPNVPQQAPNAQNTPVTTGALDKLTSMSDDQMAAVINAAKGVQMPNFLSDRPDRTQEFVFQIGLNEKPLSLDQQAFTQFLADNGMSQSDVMSRSVNGTSYRNNDGTNVQLTGQQIIDIIRDSRMNYIGGKQGGQMLGAGAYFEVNGGKNTGYGGTTMTAVLNPNTAKVINLGALSSQVSAWQRAHPKAAKAIGSFSTGRGGTASIYALCMGYNVITNGKSSARGQSRSTYVNVIDRSAMVVLK